MLAKLIVAETKPAKICGVCGDRAKSYHFGGISCDSCKAFFRRSVQNDAHRTFQCSFQGRCDITMANRKCCQHCRFRKCIDIGMETSWVMTEEERVNMLQARLWKRRPTPMTPTTTATPSSTPGGSPAPAPPPMSVVTAVSNVKRERRTRTRSPLADEDDFRNCGGLPSTDSTMRSSTTADDDCDLSSIGDDDNSCPPKRRKTLLSSDVSTSRVLDDTSSSSSVATTMTTTTTTNVDHQLSANEASQIDGILKAFHECFRSRTNLKSAASSCSSKWLLVVLFVVSIQRLVRFALALEPFTRLFVKDQVALLRSNIFEMFLVVHLCDFDGEIDDANGHDNDKDKDNDNDERKHNNFANGATSEVHRKRNCPFLAVGMPSASTLPESPPNDSSNSNAGTLSSIGHMFRAAIQGDTTTLVLLLLVVLYCPDSTELTNPADVESHQIHYCNLLGRHLRSLSRARSEAGFVESAGSPDQPPTQTISLAKLLLFLPALREMREKHVSFHFDLNDDDVESATADIIESIEKGFI